MTAIASKSTPVKVTVEPAYVPPSVRFADVPNVMTASTEQVSAFIDSIENRDHA